jgi:hypothetical protein
VVGNETLVKYICNRLLKVICVMNGNDDCFQSRYVGYFERMKYLFNSELPPRKVLRLKSIIITQIGSK